MKFDEMTSMENLSRDDINPSSDSNSISRKLPLKRKISMIPTKRMKVAVQELSLCCWNVNGLRAILRKQTLQTFLSTKMPDIVCLSETLIQPSHIESLERQLPESYFKYWATSEKKGYAGVCLLTKHEPISVKIGLGIEKHDKEGRLVTAEYDDYIVVGMYAPHLGNEQRIAYRFQEWEVDILQYIISLQIRKPVIWLGDFNVIHDSLDFYQGQSKKWPHTTALENEHFRRLLDEVSMIDSFRQINPDLAAYSYFDRRSKAKARNRGWRIDFILIPKIFRNCIQEAYIVNEVEGSDHVPCLATLNINKVALKALRQRRI